MTLSKPLKILLGIVIALVVLITACVIFILTFDWNVARPFINHQISQRTGREFAIRGDLKVTFTRGLNTEPGWRRYIPRPQISASDVQMSNPNWSSVGPQMVDVRRIVVALHPLALLNKRAVLTDVVLDAPAITLEQRADGRNNWTMKNMSDKSSSNWSVEIQRLAFARGTLRYLDESIALDLQADIFSTAAKAAENPATTLPTADVQAHTGINIKQGDSRAVETTKDAAVLQKFGLQFKLGGSYHNAPIKGSGKAGAVLLLQNDKTIYPVQVNAEIGKNKAIVNGTLTDPRALSSIDLQLFLGGNSMANLYPLIGVLLPETPAYATHGRLIGKKDGAVWNWTYQNFTGTVGASDLAGTLEYLTRQPRPLLRGAVTSRNLRLEDLGPVIGADSNAQKRARGKPPVQPQNKTLPVEQFNPEKWGALDADVKFSGQKLVRSHDIPLQNIVADIHMKDRILQITPLNFGLAEGTVTSHVSLDGRQRQIQAQIKMAARHLKIRALFPQLQSMQASLGEINGDAALTGHGNSMAAMLASSNGEFSAVTSEGSISQFILEAVGLNIANAIFVKVFGDKQIHLNCLASAFKVNNGRADVQRFVLDTDDARVDITGSIDAAQERLNLDIRPQTKGPRILSLRSPLYAKGTFEHPRIGLYKGPLMLKLGAAVALAAATPVAAVLPLVNLGNATDVDCTAALMQTMQTRTAPTSLTTAAPTKPVTPEDMKQAQGKK